MNEYPRITVVIPIRNEEAFIAQTITFVLGQDYPADRLEVIVVDGESDDSTVSIVEKIAASDPRVRLLTNPRRLSSAARNIGAQNASGDIVTYIDGHTYIDNDQLLKHTAALMLEKNVEALSRPQFLDTPDNDTFQQSVSLARKSTIGHGLDSTIYADRDMFVDPTSSGASYKRSVFEDVGYFDEKFDACEDVEFNYRVAKSGRQSFTSLKLAVYYYPRESLSRLFYQMKRYGVGRLRLARKHPGTLGIGTLIPAAFLVGLVLLPLLSIVYRPAAWLFAGAYGLYALAVVLSSGTIVLKHGMHHFFRLLAIYPTIHLGLGWGFVSELLKTLLGRGK